MVIQLVFGGLGAVLVSCLLRKKKFNTAEVTIVGAVSGLLGCAVVGVVPGANRIFSIEFFGEAAVALASGMLLGFAVFVIKDAIEVATRES